jgi:hypothetical protein
MKKKLVNLYYDLGFTPAHSKTISRIEYILYIRYGYDIGLRY